MKRKIGKPRAPGSASGKRAPPSTKRREVWRTWRLSDQKKPSDKNPENIFMERKTLITKERTGFDQACWEKKLENCDLAASFKIRQEGHREEARKSGHSKKSLLQGGKNPEEMEKGNRKR